MMNDNERTATFIRDEHSSAEPPAADAAGGDAPSLVDSESVTSFLDRIAARTPAPGGGGACAVSIGMAAALVAMVARYSTRQLAEAEQLAVEADELRGEALPLVEADATAYESLLEAFRSSGTGRADRIASAARAASEVPLLMTDIAARLAKIAVLLRSGNPNLTGDLYTAALTCMSAAAAARQLVEMNVRAGNLDSGLADAAAANVATLSDELESLDDMFPEEGGS